MAELYTLSRSSIAKLAADHERLQHMVRNLQARLQEVTSSPAAGVTMYPGKTYSEITALSSSTPGTGTADIYARDTGTGELSQVGSESETIYNVGGSVEAGQWCVCSRDAYGDWWLVVVPFE